MARERGGPGGQAVLVTTATCDDGADAAVHQVVDAVLEELGRKDDPLRYRGAWVLVRAHGRPRAAVELALPLSPPAVERALRELPAQALQETAPDRSRHDPQLVSVVVPTVVNRIAELEACVRSLEVLDHEPVEILLVDNRPGPREPLDGDPLRALLARHPGVRSVHAPRPGISAARNAGAAAARGSIVAFTDDDVTVDPGWLTAITRRFAAHPDEVAVTGLVVPAELETAAQLDYEAHYGGFGGRRSFAPVHIRAAAATPPWTAARAVVHDDEGAVVGSMPVYGIGAYGAGANMAFRRSALLEAGGFDLLLGTGTPARGGEDLAALIQVLWRGGTLGYEPAAVVHHTHRRDVPGLEHQLRGNGVGFTAMLTSLVAGDPRHALALGVLVPAAASRLVRQSSGRLLRRTASTGASAAGPTVPTGPTGLAAGSGARFVALELSGFPLGPLAYLRSRRAAGRYAEHPPGHLPDHPADDGTRTLPSPAGAPAGEGPHEEASGFTTAVVVCAYTMDRWDDLVAGCAALAAQSRRPDQVVLVVDHDAALLERSRRELPGVHVVENSGERGLSGARNSGIAACSADVVLFLDDDACPDRDWVARSAQGFEDPGVVGVGGWAEPAWDAPGRPSWFPEPFLWVVGCSYDGLPAHGASIRNPIGATMGFRRDDLLAARGFTSGIGRVGKHPVGCEETELSIRVRQRGDGTARIVLRRDAVVHHRVGAERQSVSYFVRRCFWEGYSKAVVAAAVGTQDALASERGYAARTLPAAVLRGLGRFVRRGDVAGAAQAGAVVLGLGTTTAGYAYGLRTRPRRPEAPRAVVTRG